MLDGFIGWEEWLREKAFLVSHHLSGGGGSGIGMLTRSAPVAPEELLCIVRSVFAANYGMQHLEM